MAGCRGCEGEGPTDSSGRTMTSLAQSGDRLSQPKISSTRLRPLAEQIAGCRCARGGRLDPARSRRGTLDAFQSVAFLPVRRVLSDRMDRSPSSGVRRRAETTTWTFARAGNGSLFAENRRLTVSPSGISGRSRNRPARAPAPARSAGMPALGARRPPANGVEHLVKKIGIFMDGGIVTIVLIGVGMSGHIQSLWASN